ncbi:MAG: DUF2752 domain-containing protein [Lachnospiraceae bacterium]|nr:DUF2752 domain-containing protein [Lachnospiraceae bacterium]
MKLKIIFLKSIVLIGITALLVYFGCPLYKVSGITCPACGTTRAWLSFLEGRFTDAFRYNAFFPILPLILIYATFHDMVPGRFVKKADMVFCILAVLLFIYNLLRITGVITAP